MGIHVINLDFFWESLGGNKKCLNGKNLLELGDQTMRNDVKVHYAMDSGYSKIYFLKLRCNHHSIDWNGFQGAIPLDLTEPIPIRRYKRMFDVVTDFGCMEHIGRAPDRFLGQWQAWKNIHDVCKKKGVFVHTISAKGSYPGHGFFHYSIEFFNKLCKANNYKVISIKRQSIDPRTDKRDQIFASFTRSNSQPFNVTPDEMRKWLCE